MLFNFRKCKCMHIGHRNIDEQYKMGDAVLGRITQEKDLGVTFSADMRISEPYCKKDIYKLERIQRRTTKMIPEFRDFRYESRLLECGFEDIEDIDRNMFFKLKEGSRTRGHKLLNGV